MTQDLTRLKKENAADSFSVWMRKFGTAMTDPSAKDTAASALARSAVSHGARAEGLYEKGLQGGGYARYLENEVHRGYEKARQAYDAENEATKEKNLSGYARYLTEHEEKQGNLKRKVTESISKGESLDFESAYQVALASGLTEENARAAAEIGIEAAKKQATAHLLEMILEKRLQYYRVKEYALQMGFSEEEAARFSQYAKDINTVVTPSKIPENLFE